MTWLKKKTAHLARLAALPATPAATAQDLIQKFRAAIRAADPDHRRHDSENERALVGARMANLRKGNPTGANQHSEGKAPVGAIPAITIERAAELAGSSRKNIERAKPIVQSAAMTQKTSAPWLGRGWRI